MDVTVRLDRLPAGCSLQQEGPTGDEPKVRFRGLTADGRPSRWLPWVPVVDGATVHLTWSAFWRDER